MQLALNMSGGFLPFLTTSFVAISQVTEPLKQGSNSRELCELDCIKCVNVKEGLQLWSGPNEKKK
jgi:hypothetical protein